VEYGAGEASHVNYVRGSNIAGFVKIAQAMFAYGVV
jgi:glutamate dehydrogenase (NADP+)